MARFLAFCILVLTPEWPIAYVLSFGEANTPNQAKSANPFSCPVTRKDIAVKATSVIGVFSLEDQGRRLHLYVGNNHLFEH